MRITTKEVTTYAYTVIGDLKAVNARTPAAGMKEGGNNMTTSSHPMYFRGLLTAGLLASLWAVSLTALYAAEQNNVQQKPAIAQRLFASPEEAIKALQAATGTKDNNALCDIFGPEFRELLTGDQVQDANHAKKFAAAMAQSCIPVKEGEDKFTIEIGTNNWPMPIPLVKTGGQWHFDTAAGKEEIINRHIGKDELHAIGVCRAYVTAQRQYAGLNPDASTGIKYAQQFKSSPGKKDGLYWPVSSNEPASPFGPLVAEAQAEGYVKTEGTGPKPFHGYYFRILTRQGNAAPGGEMNYIIDGSMTAGFALVAYPALWDKSGIMTFIVNQDGKLYQCNLGETTSQIAGTMEEYNPGRDWTLVQDKGILKAISEK